MRAQVTIVALGETEEALALRTLLETMGHTVRLMKVQNSARLPSALMTATTDDVVVLSAKASDKGLLIGETSIPVAEAFEGVEFRAEAVLISTANAARESGLVDAMFKAGGHLVAPNGTPERRLIVPWIAACLLGADAGLAQAVRGANTLVQPENRFSYG